MPAKLHALIGSVSPWVELNDDRSVYTVRVKNVVLVNFCDIFHSVMVNLLSSLLLKHTATYTPILVHLSEYLYELYDFQTPQILTIQLVCYEMLDFFVKKQVTFVV